MAGEDPLEELLARYAARRDAGEDLTPEDFCREHPDQAALLRPLLQRLDSTEALFPSVPDLPAAIGPYRVLDELGSGGMGRILRVAHRDRPDSVLALKLLHPGLEASPRALERFQREGRALARLCHPGLVRITDSGLTGSRPYLVMELVRGTSLARRLAAARQRREAGEADPLALPGSGSPAQRAARLVAKVARAVAAAHAAGVLHRDLNPRNVLIGDDGEPVVIDFGLGRAEDADSLTASGDLLGTPQYMAPEQARGERVGERADVYGLGALLHELLTLEPPRGRGDTLPLLARAGRRPLPAPRAANPQVPRELDTIVRRATSFRPAWRTPSAAALADDLERWLEGRSIHARPPGLFERAHDLWLLRRRALLLAAGLCLLAAGAFFFRGTTSGDATRRWEQAYLRATVAWLDDDRPELARSARAMRELRPDDELWQHFAALAEGRLLESPKDPSLAALVAGERLLRAGQADAARAQFDVAWNLRPHMPHVLVSSALTAEASGRLEAARTGFEQVASFLGASKRLHRELCRVYLGLGQTQDALKAGRTATRAAPEDPRAWLCLARAQRAAGDLPALRQTLERARALGASPAELKALAPDSDH